MIMNTWPAGVGRSAKGAATEFGNGDRPVVAKVTPQDIVEQIAQACIAI
jgi:hypothetical protein